VEVKKENWYHHLHHHQQQHYGRFVIAVINGVRSIVQSFNHSIIHSWKEMCCSCCCCDTKFCFVLFVRVTFSRTKWESRNRVV